MKKRKNLQTKDVAAQSGCAPYLVRYLYTCNRLPVVRDSKGPGYPVIFDEEAIEICRKHVQRSGKVYK